MAHGREQHALIRRIVEVDKSYFGRRRVRGKHKRGARGKTGVFGIFMRQGRVYTQIVSDSKKDTLRAIVRSRIAVAAVIHSEGWIGYDGLVDLGFRNVSASNIATTASSAGRTRRQAKGFG